MLKAGDLACREDHWVRGSKSGKPDEIGGYHIALPMLSPGQVSGRDFSEGEVM